MDFLAPGFKATEFQLAGVFVIGGGFYVFGADVEHSDAVKIAYLASAAAVSIAYQGFRIWLKTHAVEAASTPPQEGD